MRSARRVYRFEDAEWHAPVAPGTDPAKAADAGRQGAGRLLAQGDHGFYTWVVRLRPGFEAPVHSLDHEEVFMVLDGSCTFDGEPMTRFDSTAVTVSRLPPSAPHRATAAQSSESSKASFGQFCRARRACFIRECGIGSESMIG